MRPEGAGPAFVLYPPIDDDDDDDHDDDDNDIASGRVLSPTSDHRPPDDAEYDDDSASNLLRIESAIQEPASSTVPASVTTTTVGAISSASVAQGGGKKTKAGVGGAVSVFATASASAPCMSRDLATKFEALKRRKANGDEVEARHVALAEEALGMASAEIARMQRACAELEGRLGGDGGGGGGGDGEQHQQWQRQRQDRGRDPIGPGPERVDRGGGRGRGRQEENGDDVDGFPVLLPRVVVVVSSDHSTRGDMDHGGHEFDQLLDVQRSTQGEEHSELDDDNSNDP